MKINITINGKASDLGFVVEWKGMDLPTGPEDRQSQREMWESHFGEMFDGKASVWFEDECPTCGTVLRRNIRGGIIYRCPRRDCASNAILV